MLLFGENYDLQNDFLTYLSSKEAKKIVNENKIVIDEKVKKAKDQITLDYLNSVKGWQVRVKTIRDIEVVQVKENGSEHWFPYCVLDSKIIPNYIPIAYR